MTDSTVFTNNRTQAVRLPADTRFPDSVKKVAVRVVGVERIVAPIHATWDSFFLAGPMPTEDFMAERASQEQAAREPLDAVPPARKARRTSKR
jgi:antitoxin VapB